MDMEKNSTEYTPLNNLSSGEEVEQFTLPVIVNPNKQKRRRKRKEFDMLKSPSVMQKPSSLCQVSTSVTIVLFTVLIAGFCGLLVLVYQLYSQVGELQRQYAQLENTVKSHSATMGGLLSKEGNTGETVESLSAQLRNLSETLDSQADSISKQMSLIESEHSNKKLPADSLRSMEKQLAQFGSDLSSIQTDIATMKQKDIALMNRLDDFDKLFNTLTSARPVPSSQPPSTSDTRNSIEALQTELKSVNNSLTSKLSSLNEIMNRAFMNCSGLQSEFDQTVDEFHQGIVDVQFDIDNINSTMQEALDEMRSLYHNASVSSPELTSDQIEEITRRLDQLEAFVHEVGTKLDDKVAAHTEGQLVNMTISRGLEDIITRVVNEKVSLIKDDIDGVAKHSADVEGRLIILEDNFSAFTKHVYDLIKQKEATSLNATNSTVHISNPTGVTDADFEAQTQLISDDSSSSTAAKESTDIENTTPAEPNKTVTIVTPVYNLDQLLNPSEAISPP